MDTDEFLKNLKHELKESFDIDYSTIQTEVSDMDVSLDQNHKNEGS